MRTRKVICPHCGKPVFERARSLSFTPQEIGRFWRTVAKGKKCWISRAQPSGTYARLHLGGKAVLAHVASWIIHYGPILPGLEVCHSCDNPRCVRPSHLFLATHQVNMRDMVAKKRHKPQIGELNHLAKLTALDVERIRESIAQGTASIRELAARHGTSFQAIYHVARGQVWKHVQGPLLPKKPVRRLTPGDVDKIRKSRARGEKLRVIADRFKIHPMSVSNIARGLRWKNVSLHG